MTRATRVVHLTEPHDIYIGRPSKWGNPFTLSIGERAEYSEHVTRSEVIAKYEEWIRNQPELLSQLHELDGKTLGCWCKPKACHGDILVKLIHEQKFLTY